MLHHDEVVSGLVHTLMGQHVAALSQSFGKITDVEALCYFCEIRGVGPSLLSRSTITFLLKAVIAIVVIAISDGRILL